MPNGPPLVQTNTRWSQRTSGGPNDRPGSRFPVLTSAAHSLLLHFHPSIILLQLERQWRSKKQKQTSFHSIILERRKMSAISALGGFIYSSLKSVIFGTDEGIVVVLMLLSYLFWFFNFYSWKFIFSPSIFSNSFSFSKSAQQLMTFENRSRRCLNVIVLKPELAKLVSHPTNQQPVGACLQLRLLATIHTVRM